MKLRKTNSDGRTDEPIVDDATFRLINRDRDIIWKLSFKGLLEKEKMCTVQKTFLEQSFFNLFKYDMVF